MLRARPLITVVLGACALALGACGSSDEPAGGGASTSSGSAPASKRIQPVAGASSKPEITVGSKNFTEQFILGEMYAQALRAAGFEVRTSLDIGSELLAYKALRRGSIDAYPEYTGTALTSFFDVPVADAPKDGAVAYRDAKADYAKVGITAFPPTKFNSTYGVVIPKAEAASLGNPTKMSDLRPYASKLKISAYPECRQRTDCYIGFQKAYDLKFKGFVGTSELYQALKADASQVSFVTATDGDLASGDYVSLEDDRDFFPAYNATLTMRDDAAAEIGPDGAKIIEAVQSTLTDQVMQELNARVDVDKQTPAQAAKEYLVAGGFIAG